MNAKRYIFFGFFWGSDGDTTLLIDAFSNLRSSLTDAIGCLIAKAPTGHDDVEQHPGGDPEGGGEAEQRPDRGLACQGWGLSRRGGGGRPESRSPDPHAFNDPWRGGRRVYLLRTTKVARERNGPVVWYLPRL